MGLSNKGRKRMVRPGEYADILRSVGHLLDSLDASAIDIHDDGANLVVAWVGTDGSRGERVYGDVDLNDLRLRSQYVREGVLTAPPGERAELLRVVGHNLDTQGIFLERIAELGDGFRVTGAVMGEYVSQWYSRGGLRSQSDTMRLERNAPEPKPSGIDVIRERPRRSRGQT